MTIDELNRKLLEATKREDIEGMLEAVKQGAEVNSRDGWGRMAMQEIVRGRRGLSRPHPYKKQGLPSVSGTLDFTAGADFRTRTGDPILTMDVLYLLS